MRNIHPFGGTTQVMDKWKKRVGERKKRGAKKVSGERKEGKKTLGESAVVGGGGGRKKGERHVGREKRKTGDVENKTFIEKE